MNETLILVLAGAAGVGLGAVFFGGLWWTVRRGLASRRPALWFLGSGLLRTAMVLAGFYFVSGGQWQRLTACLVGFIAARLVVMGLMRHRPKHSPRHGESPTPHPFPFHRPSTKK